jgi:HSP20 family protein
VKLPYAEELADQDVAEASGRKEVYNFTLAGAGWRLALPAHMEGGKLRLTRLDPFREMVDIRRRMDEMMQRAFSGGEGEQPAFGMDVDGSETEEAYEIEAAMPGIKPEDIDVTLDSNVLTIRGKMKAEQEEKGKTYHVRERRVGSFARSITLPTTVDADKIEARYEDGVLKLRLPKAEEARPKRIEIKKGK